MQPITQTTIQVTDVKHGKFRHPMISFTLSIAVPTAPAPETRPLILSMEQCVAKPYKKWETKDNPNGWRWNGPIKWQSRSDMVTVIRMNEELQQVVLGILHRGGHLKVSEHYNSEWINARWRVASDDETEGILLK